jgi:hypothetical protein
LVTEEEAEVGESGAMEYDEREKAGAGREPNGLK